MYKSLSITWIAIKCNGNCHIFILNIFSIILVSLRAEGDLSRDVLIIAVISFPGPSQVLEILLNLMFDLKLKVTPIAFKEMYSTSESIIKGYRLTNS